MWNYTNKNVVLFRNVYLGNTLHSYMNMIKKNSLFQSNLFTTKPNVFGKEKK